jgi:hypothetical protein
LVRSLQARILNEEWEKREELEKLQEEQRRLLDLERNKTKTFQRRQTEMERQLEGKGYVLQFNSNPSPSSQLKTKSNNRLPTTPPPSLSNSCLPQTLLTAELDSS